MHKILYTSAVSLALAFHVLWILFVMTGALFTRRRPKLAALHIASLAWGIVVETGPWPCPLTLAENFLEVRAGITPYAGSFLVHYLDRLVYPNLPVWLITACAVAVCGANLAAYGYRFGNYWKRRRAA